MPISKINSVYYFQGFTLDLSKRRLSNSRDLTIKLGSRAFDTLVELVQHQGTVVTKDYLMSAIWTDMVVEENNINRVIWTIRKALDDSSSESRFIQTISGQGYCFIADITEGETNHKSTKTANIKKTLVDSMSSHGAEKSNNDSTPQYFKTAFLILGALACVALFYLFTQDMHKGDEQPQEISTLSSDSANSIIPASIAVMPFTNINQDENSELFVLSLHDELIHQLSKVTKLKVIARDSIMSLHEDGKSVFEITELLKVESLIEGSILVMGDNARINLEMLDASTGVVLWADSVTSDIRDISEMISIQSKIALNVVNALEVEIQAPESASIAMISTQSFEAYRYYLAARTNYKHQDDGGKWVLVKKALELDPEYSEALLFFASINSALAITPLDGFTTQDHVQYMNESIDAYIRLKPERSEGYALKSIALGMERNWEGIAEQISTLKQLDATFSEMKYLSMLLLCFGDFQSAIKIYEESLITEPVNLYSRALLMLAHEIAGNREQARKEYAIGNELKSAWWGDSVNILLALGRKEPLEGINDLGNITPQLSYVLNNLNNPKIISQGVKNYINDEAKIISEAIYYSALAAYSGDTNSASSLLRTSMNGAATSIFWAWLPVFDELRRTENFKNMLMDFGLVSYWQNHGWPKFCQPDKATFNCEWSAYQDMN